MLNQAQGRRKYKTKRHGCINQTSTIQGLYLHFAASLSAFFITVILRQHEVFTTSHTILTLTTSPTILANPDSLEESEPL